MKAAASSAPWRATRDGCWAAAATSPCRAAPDQSARASSAARALCHRETPPIRGRASRRRRGSPTAIQPTRAPFAEACAPLIERGRAPLRALRRFLPSLVVSCLIGARDSSDARPLQQHPSPPEDAATSARRADRSWRGRALQGRARASARRPSTTTRDPLCCAPCERERLDGLAELLPQRLPQQQLHLRCAGALENASPPWSSMWRD